MPLFGSTRSQLGGGARVLQTLTSPPVTTTAYQNTTGVNLECSLAFTLTSSVSVAADMKVEISPDNSAWTTWADPSLPIGSQLAAGSVGAIIFPVPKGWYYRVTSTNSTIGALIAIG